MSDLLHIKDAYYFEVPRILCKWDKKSADGFPPHYVRLDPDFQDWEAVQLYRRLDGIDGLEGVPPQEELIEEYQHWRHEPANFAKPFDRFLEEAPSQGWFQRQLCLRTYARRLSGESDQAYEARQLHGQTLVNEWEVKKANLARVDLERYLQYEADHPWSAAKIESYNRQLDGKIIIPQPFGRLRNNYEAESGFCISKFMILELVIAALLIFAFKRLASYVKDGRPVKGKLWNMFEAFLMFIRDDIARPAIGGHDADRFVPLLWTMFMFVLTCNLFGMLPWLGAPTGAFGVTLGLAAVTFATGVFFGSKRFGFLGFWKNLVPSMDMPLPLKIPIVLVLFPIELLGLCIKHAVLGIRLLANMVAGHLVLLAILGLAVAAATHAGAHLGSSYWITATIAVVGSALFSLLELFVAFLQAYVFTFLSALFIGAAIHHH